MKRLIGGFPLVRALIPVLGVLALFSCFKEEDMRAKTVAELGEPDEIQYGGWGPDEYELYFYDHKDINRVYQYRKSAPGCGSKGEWYVVNVYYSDYHFGRELYQPPIIAHSPVETAAPGTKITITAKITDDKYVKEAITNYRMPGEEHFLPMTMSLDDSVTYSAHIPPERVTEAGIEYYIEASDATHKSRLPERKGYFMITVSHGAEKTVAKPLSTTTPVPPVFAPSARQKSGAPL